MKRHIVVGLFGGLVGGGLLLWLLATTGAFLTNAPLSALASPVSAAARYGQLPLSFVPNAGQSNATVRYQAHGMGGMLFFEDDAVVLVAADEAN